MKVHYFNGTGWASPDHDGRIDIFPDDTDGRLPRFRIREVDGKIQIESWDGPITVHPVEDNKIRIDTRQPS